MTFLTFGKSFSEVNERKPVPRGVYHLIVEDVADHKSKEGNDSLKVTILIDGHETASKVIEYLSLPMEKDDPDKVYNKMLRIKRFLTTFNVPHEDTGFNQEDLFGAQADCELVMTDPDDDPNGNVYNKVNLPRLEDGGDSPGQAAPRKPAARKR